MSNLGGYQKITTISKKLGGPGKFVASVFATGFLSGAIATKGSEKIASIKSKKKTVKGTTSREYIVKKDGTSNEGMVLAKGDRFRVLENDGDAVLIEKDGDGNNPYFVSSELLKDISEYK